MTSWYWLRLPSGVVVNMALVSTIVPVDGGNGLRRHVKLYYSGDSRNYTAYVDADADAILAWVPGNEQDAP